MVLDLIFGICLPKLSQQNKQTYWALVENLCSAISCSTATYLTGFYLGVEKAGKGLVRYKIISLQIFSQSLTVKYAM